MPPDKEMFAGFTQLYWSKDNNPAAIELKVLEMGENDLPKLHVGLAHVNPGGWTYTEGWGPMNRAYVEVMDENTKIREMAALQARVAKMESRRTSLLDLDSKDDKISLGGLGGGMLLAGTLALAGWRRREKSEALTASSASTPSTPRRSNRRGGDWESKLLPSLGILLVTGGLLLLIWFAWLWFNPGPGPLSLHPG